MPTIRRVPDPYPTFQAAHDAAADGDTILLAPGTYYIGYRSGWLEKITKQVNIQGEGDSPSDVILASGTNSVQDKGVMMWNASITQPTWIDNLTFLYNSTYSHYTCTFMQSDVTLASTEYLNINRCIFSSPLAYDDSNRIQHSYLTNSSSVFKIAYTNCDFTDYCSLYNWGNASNRIMRMKCATNYGIDVSQYSSPAPPDGFIEMEDVAAPGTELYGSAYGSAPDLNAWDWRIAGTVAIDNTSPDDVSIRLFIADATNGIRETAFSTTKPDPTTGAWEFNYLPSDVSYYVAVVPPAGYRPELIGPYEPEQN